MQQEPDYSGYTNKAFHFLRWLHHVIRNPDSYLNLTGQNGVPWPTSTAKESREVGIVIGHIAVSNKSDTS